MDQFEKFENQLISSYESTLAAEGKEICMKLVPFVIKQKLVENTVRNFPAARNSRPNSLHNCRFASNWPKLSGSQSLSKTPDTTFVLLEIRAKSHCPTVVLLQIGPSC